MSLVGVMKFTPGFHETVTEPSSVITCPSGIGNIIFNNHSMDISFKYITVKHCSGISEYAGISRICDSCNYLALLFHEVFNLALYHVAVVDSEGMGLIVWNCYGTHVESSCFANNTGNAFFFYTQSMKCFTSRAVFDLFILSASNFSFSQKTDEYCSKCFQIKMIVQKSKAVCNIEFGYKFVVDDTQFSLVLNNSVSFISTFGVHIAAGFSSYPLLINIAFPFSIHQILIL